MSAVMDSMLGLTKASGNLLTGGKGRKKGKKDFMDDEMRAEIENAKRARAEVANPAPAEDVKQDSSDTPSSPTDGSGVMNW